MTAKDMTDDEKRSQFLDQLLPNSSGEWVSDVNLCAILSLCQYVCLYLSMCA